MVLVSVVIPMYNVEEYIEDCLISLKEQTYKNIEILVINDGSTDNSLTIAKNIAKEDNRIKVYTKENGGLSSARNYALNKISGDYITFVDSDDYVSKNFIEKLLDMINKYSTDIAICGYSRLEDKRIVHTLDNYYEELLTTKKIIADMYNNKDSKYISYITAWGKLYKTSLFEGISYPSKKHEDEFITYRLYLKTNRICYVNEELYIYRIRSGSIMGSGFNLNYLDKMDMYEERIAVLKSYSLDTTNTERCLLKNQKECIYLLDKYGYIEEKASIKKRYKENYKKYKHNLSYLERIKHKLANGKIYYYYLKKFIGAKPLE